MRYFHFSFSGTTHCNGRIIGSCQVEMDGGFPSVKKLKEYVEQKKGENIVGFSIISIQEMRKEDWEDFTKELL